MFGSNWAEAIVAAVVGLVGAAVQFSCKKGHMHMFVENIVCSLSVAVAIGFLTAALPGTYDTDLLIISCIMPFVPGAAITNAVFDTLHGDYLSGLARAAEAFAFLCDYGCNNRFRICNWRKYHASVSHIKEIAKPAG